MWERRSHKLVDLTKIMPSKVKFKLTKIEQKLFKEIKPIVTCSVLLSYPYLINNLKPYQC